MYPAVPRSELYFIRSEFFGIVLKQTSEHKLEFSF